MATRKSTSPGITGPCNAVLRLRTADGFRKSTVWVERQNFYGHSQFDHNDAYLIVGFDTEYKTPDKPITLEDMKTGSAKYNVLSYQVHCSVFDPAQPEAREWSAICYPEPGERLTLIEVLLMAFSKGVSSGSIVTLPTRIYVVGHFTRADVPALADFKDLSTNLSAVRSTFTSVRDGVTADIEFDGEDPVKLLVILRDTMLLTPEGAKSLKSIGDLVGVPKMEVDPDTEKARFYKSNMNALLADNIDLFEDYAINDAVICVRYLQRLIGMYFDLFGKPKAPATLTAIGVDLLMKNWKDDLDIDPLYVVGKERISAKIFHKRFGYFVTEAQIVPLEHVSLHLQLATECYHGGRGEQFWFGPAFEDDWTDYDLSGAYPTAMALIGFLDWEKMRPTTNLKDYTATTLGVARVEFEFPKSVRFPTLPVRTENGLVFPRKGVSYCSAPEIVLARQLRASLKITHGVVVPTNPDKPVFRDFIRDCVVNRRKHPKGTLDNLFWKELSNSSYGKTAQGLRSKRVFNLSDRTMKDLPESKITNPFYAAFITSFVRAALGEVMNALPEGICVFSCTTDGFLTNATGDQIDSASTGTICKIYEDSRVKLTGDPTVLEIKHHVRQPLGWRTRGQATLIEGTSGKGDDTNIVLAKGGIYTPESDDTVRLKNAFITNLFFNRTPIDRITMATKVGIREMLDFDADLVPIDSSKRLNMEFDWKRRPTAVWDAVGPDHLAFSTMAWDTVDDFINIRRYWEIYASDEKRRCLKTAADYRDFATSVLSQSSLEGAESKWLKKVDPDINRLRASLCAAWRQSKAGLDKKVDRRTAQKFADILTAAGVACKATDIENARKPFLPNSCPNTPAVKAALRKLKSVFPNLNADEIVTSNSGIDIVSAMKRRNPFLALAKNSKVLTSVDIVSISS